MKQSTYSLLRTKYPEQEAVLMAEVSDGTGARTRSLDWMVLTLWSSRGQSLIGFEEKTWRTDWLRELKNPAKQEKHFKYCDYFYLLTTGEGVAKADEIPENWGWMHVKGGKIYTMKHAPKLAAQPITRDFLCAMMRRAADKSGFVHRTEIEAKVEEKLSYEIKKAGIEVETLKSQNEFLSKAIKDFQTESGIDITGHRTDRYQWKSPADVGKAVKYVLSHGLDGHLTHLKDATDRLEQFHRQAKKALEELTEITKYETPKKEQGE